MLIKLIKIKKLARLKGIFIKDIVQHSEVLIKLLQNRLWGICLFLLSKDNGEENMLTRTGIRNLTHASFYARGLDLYLLDKVKELNIEETSFVEYVSTKVKGSGTKVYDVRFHYDKAKDAVSDCSCGCPAFASYDGLCKHLVAALLKYVDKKATGADISGDRASQGQVSQGQASQSQTSPGQALPGRDSLTEDMVAALFAQGAKMDRGHKRLSDYLGEDYFAPSTTPAMKQFLEKQLSRRMLPFLQDQNFGRIQLEPTLTCEKGKASVEFRVGAAHKYVIKDIFEFDRHMQEEEEHQYGKQLKFVHISEAFAADSQEMVQFIRNWVRENGRRYVQSYYYGYRSQAKLRSMPLSAGELEAFLEAAGELPIQVITQERDLGLCHQVEGAPERKLTLAGQDGGVVLAVKHLTGCKGSKHHFWFEKGLIYRESLEAMKPIADFLACMETLPEGKAYIQKEDVPMFCRDLLPVLGQYYACTRKNFSESDYDIEAVNFEIYLDAPQEDMISCRLIAIYGERRYNVYGDKEDMGQRDLTREIPVGKVVSSYCNAYDESTQAMVIADAEEMMYEFLTEGIPRLQELGQVFISDALKKIKVNSSPRISVGISLAGDLLELTMTHEDMSREQLLEILNKYDRKKKYYRLKSGEFVNVAGDGLETLLELRQGLGLSDKQMREETIELPKFRALYLDAGLRDQEAVLAEKNRAFRALVRNMKTVEDNDFEVPQVLQNVLREYQKKGFLWLKTLKHNGFGGILADDMGLGKTLQVIAFLCSEYGAGDMRCLIVTPASLVYNWYNEFRRFAPDLPAMMVIGGAKEREHLITQAPSQVILITSYDLLKRDIEYYEKLHFFCQVIDEAQFIKNHNTQAARAVKEIKASCKLALTGTPVENRLSELWSIFDYLMPGFLFGYQRFREELETPIVQQQDEKAMERLQKMIRPFVLRRLKKDVLKDLPDKLEEDVYACMEGEQRKLYDAHVKRLALMLDKQSDEEFKTAKIQILAELTRLRQLCCDPSLVYNDYHDHSAKVEMCLDLIQNAVNGGHKILLFSQFTSMLEILCNRLEEEGITFYTLTGATSKEKRRELVEQFNRDDTSVFCISLKAGGTGLNLTAADIVIHYDPWWNLAVQNQATDRAHRIGQKNTVTVYRLVTKGTIEENIIRLQEKKKELADQVLSGEGVGSGSFTREELKEIIGVL